jgi:hypothetical protein
MAAGTRAPGVGELLAGGFTLYRRNFALFFGTALLPMVPILLLWLLSALSVVAEPGTATSASGALFTAYELSAAVLMMGALTYGAARVHAGEQATIGELLGQGLRYWPRLALATVVLMALTIIGIVLLIVPGVIVIIIFFAVYPVIMVEGRGVFAAMARSRELARGAWLRILGVVVAVWVVAMLPMLGAGAIAATTTGAGAFFDAVPGAVEATPLVALLQALSTLGSVLTIPFFLIVTVLLYYERRAALDQPEPEEANGWPAPTG